MNKHLNTENKTIKLIGLWMCVIPMIVVFSDFSSASEIQTEFTKSIEETDQKSDFYNSILNEQERVWLQNHQKIRLGVDPSWAPFEFFDQDGVYSGVASGYIHLINEMLRINLVPDHNESWSTVVAKSKSFEIDVLPAVGITPERLQYLNFTQAYISFPTVIATRNKAQFVGNLNILSI